MSMSKFYTVLVTMSDRKQFEVVGEGLLVRAPAKINLSLLVNGKRPDGFHEIETIMAKVDFFDEILIEAGTKEGIELVCRGPHWAPQGRGNLVYQACELLLKETGLRADIKIRLTKNIPAGAGLGSASSDAAAVLMGVNRFLKLGVGAVELVELAGQLGSDVPFFLDGPLGFCSGRGEKIEKLRQGFNFLALLILPAVSVSTKKVYAKYKEDSVRYEGLRAQLNSLIEKNRIDLVPGMCANMLEVSCFGLYGKLGELKRQIESSGVRPLCLSGSGSAVFYIVEGGEKARAAESQAMLAETLGCKSIIVSSNRW